MRGARSTVVPGAVAAAMLVTVAPVCAAEAVRLAWSRGEGADACIGESELAARVRSRLGADPFDEAAQRVIEGHVVPVEDGFRADLLVRAPDGAVVGRRTIETKGADCVSLGQAVTLAVVLTIDPNAPLANDESTASYPIDRPPEPAPPPTIAPAPPPNRAPPVQPAPCPTCPPREPRLGLHGGFVGAVGLLPRAALGVELEGASPALPTGLVVGARWLPSVETHDGHIALGIVSAKLGYCGALARSELAVSLCGGFEAGVLTVVARDLEPVSPGDYPYLGITAGPRLVWPARSPLSLHAGVFGVIPLIRQRFQVENGDSPAFQASPVAAVAFLGLGFEG